MLSNMKKLAAETKEYVIGMRRHFHMYPESSLQEFETCKTIQKELTAMGIPFTVVKDIGVFADIKGAKPGKTVALRADNDALEITEKAEVPYVSKVPGKMHACGHDAHTAMLLGAAKVLTSMKGELAGTVRLVFQPAEENLQGAKVMIDGGCLEGVDSIFGIHVSSSFDKGLFDCNPGPRMASADALTVMVEGVSGHGSRPDMCVDAVVATAAIVNNLQTIVSREINPNDAGVVTVGKMHAGTRVNIIANHGEMELSVRAYLPETRKKLLDSIARIAKGTGEALMCKVDVRHDYGCPPCINEPGATAIARAAIAELFGEQSMLLRDRATGSEDFSFYVEKVPGAFCMLGAAPVTGPVSAHHELFDINEDAMENGVMLYCAYALKALAQ